MTKSILEIAKECGAAVHGPFVVEVPGGSVTQSFTTFSHEQLQSLATKLREEVKAEQWQPIETAPLGRTLLLGYYNKAGKWRTVRGEWISAETIEHEWDTWEHPSQTKEWEGWYEVSAEADEPPSCWWIKPTHWQPLPPPPAQREGSKS